MGNSMAISSSNDSKTYIIDTLNGKYMIWYLMFTAWGTDIFAYVFGKKFGKHKFSKVSPNKTVEGCVSGVVRSYNTYINIYILLKYLCRL